MNKRDLRLQAVLDKINEEVADFENLPDFGPNDRGVYQDYPMHKVAIWGDIESASVLLAYGADIDARGEDEETPLQRAIAGRKVDMIEYLLKQGADPDLKDMYGHSARSV